MSAHEIARQYLGTPYAHQARLKGVAVDCVGLLICVAREAGKVPADFDITGYLRTPDGFSLMRHLADWFDPIAREQMGPGDFVCVAYDKFPHHVGVIGDYVHGGLSIIHADSKRGHVTETRLMFTDAMRFVAAFRFREEA